MQRLEDEDEWTIKVKLDDRDTTESTVEVEVRAIIVEVIRKSSSQRVMKTCQPVMQDARWDIEHGGKERKTKREEQQTYREKNQGALYARTLSFKNSKRAGTVVAERLVISSIQ